MSISKIHGVQIQITISRIMARHLEKACGPLEPFTQVELTLKLLADHIIKELPHPEEMLEEFKILRGNSAYQGLTHVSTSLTPLKIFLYRKSLFVSRHIKRLYVDFGILT